MVQELHIKYLKAMGVSPVLVCLIVGFSDLLQSYILPTVGEFVW